MSGGRASAASGDAVDVGRAVTDVLARSPRRAMFLTEVCARIPRADLADVERAVAAGVPDSFLLVDHPSPDPHLQGDLRVAALVDSQVAGRSLADAQAAADEVWTTWLRDILAHHRCG